MKDRSLAALEPSLPPRNRRLGDLRLLSPYERTHARRQRVRLYLTLQAIEEHPKGKRWPDPIMTYEARPRFVMNGSRSHQRENTPGHVWPCGCWVPAGYPLYRTAQPCARHRGAVGWLA